MNEVGLKDQCFGVEVELTGITREQAAQALADYFGTEKWVPDTPPPQIRGIVWKWSRPN